jgi:AraC family transcriptional regulator, activator of mtrCDE
VAGEPFWRISRQDLDRLMTTLDVTLVRLSECALAAGAHLAVARANASTIHYCLRGAGVIVLDDETPIRLTPHTLVIVPPGRAMTVAATEHATAPRNAGRYNNGGFTPGSSQRHTVGDGEPALALACGSFRANYGPALDLFASLATPIVETFDVHDQLDQVMAYAMAELAAQDVGGGPMSAALLKLVLLALLRRCLVSTNAWVERFSILSDPPIARAFAEMASRLSMPHTVQSLSHVFRRLRRVPDVVAPPGEDAPRGRPARSQRAVHRPGRLERRRSEPEQLHARTFRGHYGSDPSEYRVRAQCASSDSATPAEDAIEESDAA